MYRFENKQMFCRQGCRCEQQYRLHRLLAYDPSNDCRGIFSDWFRFPSCCVCRCYDLPSELRLTSRSPRFSKTSKQEWDDLNSPPWKLRNWWKAAVMQNICDKYKNCQQFFLTWLQYLMALIFQLQILALFKILICTK